MDPVDLLIENGTVITVDGERRVFEPGTVAVRGPRIVAVGETSRLQGLDAARRIDASGMLVLPGFIDAHHHTVQYFAKGIGDDLPQHISMHERIFPYEAQLTPEDAHLSALCIFAEMILHGTTCFCDPGGYHMEEVGRAMEEMGMRGILSRCARDVQDPAHPLTEGLMASTRETLRESEEFVLHWNGRAEGRIRAWFSIRSSANATDTLCRELKALADSHGVGLHSHAQGHPMTEAGVRDLFGVETLERYRRLGLFGPNLYLAHMGWVKEEEIPALAEGGVKVAHCPSASMAHGLGCIRGGVFPKMLDAGVTVTLGTDSASISRTLDMVRMMYLTSYGHKEVTMDPTILSAHRALEMATRDGAQALLWEDEIGSLEEGKRADITLVRTDGPEWWPMIDPVSNLVYSADGNSVDTVLIDGRIVLEGRRLLALDLEAALDRAREAHQRLMTRWGMGFGPKWAPN